MPKFVDDLDVEGAFTAHSGNDLASSEVRAAPGQVEPIQRWIDGDGLEAGKVQADGTVVGRNFVRQDGEPIAPPGPFIREGSTIKPLNTGDGWVVGSDRFSRDSADTSKDIRSFFNKLKGAFRAGKTTGTQWDDSNVGLQSFAIGANTTASAPYSYAEGYDTTASGNRAHAQGMDTVASGYDSHAEGFRSRASGLRSHAEGNDTKAEGDACHTEGYQTRASYYYSHAEGSSTTASGAAAHAEGQGTVASGGTSHAEGRNSVAFRMAQHSHGAETFSAKGDAQMSRLVHRVETVDATARLLQTFGDFTAAPILSGANTTVFTLAPSRVSKFKVDVAARRTDTGGEVAGWEISGLVARDATGDAYLVGAADVQTWNVPGSSTWDVTVSVNVDDATNNYLAITATGEAGKTIRWLASLHVTEVG